MLSQDTRPERVKFIYNAQFPADTVVVLNNPHFTVRRAIDIGQPPCLYPDSDESALAL